MPQHQHPASLMCPNESVCESIPPNITSTTNLINININNSAGTITSVAAGESHQAPTQPPAGSKDTITSTGYGHNSGGLRW